MTKRNGRSATLRWSFGASTGFEASNIGRSHLSPCERSTLTSMLNAASRVALAECCATTFDLSRRSVATDQSPPTPTGSGTETDLLRSLHICTVSKKELENEPDREEADDSPQAALHVERN